jgi:hypothetical protein
MPEYTVTWTMQLDAASPEGAAREAYAAICRPGSIAHVFEVSASGGPAVEIDLDRPRQCQHCGSTVYNDSDACEPYRSQKPMWLSVDGDDEQCATGPSGIHAVAV